VLAKLAKVQAKRLKARRTSSNVFCFDGNGIVLAEIWNKKGSGVVIFVALQPRCGSVVVGRTLETVGQTHRGGSSVQVEANCMKLQKVLAMEVWRRVEKVVEERRKAITEGGKSWRW